MTNRYAFLRPLLAADQSWAAIDLVLAPPAASAAKSDQPPPEAFPTSFFPSDFIAAFGPGKAARWPVLARTVQPEAIDGDPVPPPKGYGLGAPLTPFFIPLRPEQADGQRTAALTQAGLGSALWHSDALSFQALVDGQFAGTTADVVDAHLAREAISPHLLLHFREEGRPLVGLQVTNRNLFDWCAARGFTLLSAEFISRSETDPNAPTDPTKLKLLRLLSLVVQDAPTQDLEEVFRGEPKLLYNLLRLVNSVSVGSPSKVSSLSQALMLLGRRQLQRWLQLLIYANQFSQAHQQPNPLLKQAAYRGSLLEGLLHDAIAERGAEECPDCAYMVGVFSLLPTLLHLPMADILVNLPLPDEVGRGLLEGDGTLGWGLALIAAAEQGRFDEASAALGKAGVAPETWLRIQQQAFGWTSQLAVDN